MQADQTGLTISLVPQPSCSRCTSSRTRSGPRSARTSTPSRSVRDTCCHHTGPGTHTCCLQLSAAFHPERTGDTRRQHSTARHSARDHRTGKHLSFQKERTETLVATCRRQRLSTAVRCVFPLPVRQNGKQLVTNFPPPCTALQREREHSPPAFHRPSLPFHCRAAP